MPHYFFHLYNDVDAADDEGMVLADLDAAIAYAAQQARALIGEMVKGEGRFNLNHRIDIEDKAGAVLTTVYFRDAVQIEQ